MLSQVGDCFSAFYGSGVTLVPMDLYGQHEETTIWYYGTGRLLDHNGDY